LNDYAIKLLQELVSIPSVNPGFSAAPAEYTGEERLGNFLLDWARCNNIEVQRFTAAEGRPCILLSTGPKNAPSLLVSAHTDTVWTEMSAPFQLQQCGDFLYGLGAVDDKGPLASALCAIRELNKKKISLRFQVLATCDEEFGLIGIRYIIPEKLRPDLVIVAEPTSLQLIRAHKGSSRFTFRTTGESAHSSLVPKGENAIYKAARLVCALEKYSQSLLQEPPHPLLGTNTLCVGTIHGGTQTSSVPDKCLLQVNFRSLPGETLETIRERLHHALDSAETEYELAEEIFDAAPLDTPEDISLIKRLQKILKQEGLDPTPRGVPYATESFRAAEFGIPAIVFGPGNIETAHTAGERIEIKQFLKAASLLVALVENWR
jgi:acetylornithine deacetylase/succinyl-diaminopimelate desuccinylase-like protein